MPLLHRHEACAAASIARARDQRPERVFMIFYSAFIIIIAMLIFFLMPFHFRHYAVDERHAHFSAMPARHADIMMQKERFSPLLAPLIYPPFPTTDH